MGAVVHQAAVVGVAREADGVVLALVAMAPAVQDAEDNGSALGLIGHVGVIASFEVGTRCGWSRRPEERPVAAKKYSSHKALIAKERKYVRDGYRLGSIFKE
jgi:hypothetical protein